MELVHILSYFLSFSGTLFLSFGMCVWVCCAAVWVVGQVGRWASGQMGRWAGGCVCIHACMHACTLLNIIDIHEIKHDHLTMPDPIIPQCLLHIIDSATE